MRLIDADFLKNIHGMKDNCAECDKELRHKSRSCEFDRVYTLMDFCGWIDDTPTIELKKGKWIEDAETFYKAVNEKGGGVDADTPFFTEDYIACSECLSLFNVIDNETERFDFCPHCGARLEEGEADD